MIPPKRKYRNVPTVYDGRRYSSKAEARHAMDLDMLRRAGVVRYWMPQPRFNLGCTENVYVADFLVWNPDGTTYAVDVKGTRTAKFNRDVKLWARYGPCALHIVGSKGAVEVITPGQQDAA